MLILTKKDTTVCPGSPVTLNAKYDTTGAIIKSHKFLWSTGDTAASITVRPLKTTKYYVTVTVENVSRKDSVTISVFPTPVFNPLAHQPGRLLPLPWMLAQGLPIITGVLVPLLQKILQRMESIK